MEQLTNEIRLATETLSSCGDGSSPEQKQDLLIAATELVEKLEGPEVGIWRVVFGVSVKYPHIGTIRKSLVYILTKLCHQQTDSSICCS
jgi:hypothetical protein